LPRRVQAFFSGVMGNLVGGSVLVALVYYVIYRWPLRRTSTLEPSHRASDG